MQGGALVAAEERADVQPDCVGGLQRVLVRGVRGLVRVRVRL